jgi:hypothetical protein
MRWVVVYELERDEERLRHMQEASLERPDVGLLPNPLVGGREWWDQIESGRRPTHRIEGTIEDVYWASMGDWPGFRIRAADGSESTWTREGEPRRYVEGLGVRLAYVEHPWKPEVAETAGLGETSKIVLTIEIEDSHLRSSGIGPGPGGVGYELARKEGDVVHYLALPTKDEAREVERAIEGSGVTAMAARQPSAGSWLVHVWHRDTGAAERHFVTLRELAIGHGGAYDGGEVIAIGGEVWGPAGPTQALASPAT